VRGTWTTSSTRSLQRCALGCRLSPSGKPHGLSRLGTGLSSLILLHLPPPPLLPVQFKMAAQIQSSQEPSNHRRRDQRRQTHLATPLLPLRAPETRDPKIDDDDDGGCFPSPAGVHQESSTVAKHPAHLHLRSNMGRNEPFEPAHLPNYRPGPRLDTGTHLQ
jgi:hypothetical protein